MTALDAADLVVIAARTLGIGNDAALASMDVPAAQAALAEADRPGPTSGAAPSDRDNAAAAGAELVRALLRHRPFARQNQQVAVAAGLQLLSLNGWQADLNPAETAAVVVEALASGRLTAAVAATWLSPRLSPAPRALPVRRPLAPVRRTTLRLARLLPEVPPRVGRAAAGALFAGAVGGVTVLAAACSHAPGTASARTDAVRQTQTRQQEPARPADLAYTACMRSHGITRFPEPSPAGVVAIAPATGIDPSSTRFRSVEQACRTAVPAAVIRIVTVPAR